MLYIRNWLVFTLFTLLLCQQLLVYLVGEGSGANLLDDFVCVVFLPFFLFVVTRKNHWVMLSLCYVLAKALIFLAINQNGSGFFSDLLFIYKPIIIFWSFSYLFLNINAERLEAFEKWLRYFMIFTILYGLLQFMGKSFLNIELPMNEVKYFQGGGELIGDRFGIVRISSIFGHPLFYGYLSCFFGAYAMFKKRRLDIIIGIVGVLLSFSRWALFLYLLSFAAFLYTSKSVFFKTFLYGSIIIIIGGAIYYWDLIIFTYDNLWSGYNENAIKMIGISKATDLTWQNPIGYGVGTFGTINSVGFTDYGIGNFNDRLIGSLSGIEAFLFILFVQLGIDGAIMYFLPFLKRAKINESGWFYVLLLIFPIISLYNISVLILASIYSVLMLNGENLRVRKQMQV